MKVSELIHRLELMIADSGADPEIVVNEEPMMEIDLGYRPETGMVHLDTYDPRDQEEEETPESIAAVEEWYRLYPEGGYEEQLPCGCVLWRGFNFTTMKVHNASCTIPIPEH